MVLSSTYPADRQDTQPRFVHLLCANLVEQGFDVTVLAPNAPGLSALQQVDGVRIIRYRYFFRSCESLAYGSGILENLRNSPSKWMLVPFFFLGQAVALARLLHREHWDLIHAHWVIPQGLIALLIRSLLKPGVPVMVTSHGGDLYALHNQIGRMLKRWVLSHADMLTVVSHAMKHFIQKQLKIKRSDILVLSMGVDLRERFSFSSADQVDSHKLIYVGRLAEKKGVSVLLDAINLIKIDYPKVHLCIVGDGVLREQLEQKVRDLRITDQVSFLGAVRNDEVPGLLKQCCIAVVPSIVASDGDQEGLGLTAVEAMGCGCAVVASDLPALKDIVEDGVTGLFAKAGSEIDIAKKIAKLIEDKQLREDLRKNARDRVLSCYDWSVIGKAYSDFITDSLTRG